MKKCRIINGILRHRYIIAPDVNSTRPTADIVKQSIFNVLLHRYQLFFSEFCVIDMFAGSGSLGFESLSLGCKNVIWCDNNKNAIACIKYNINTLKIIANTNIYFGDARNLSLDEFTKYENILIFLDPPYVEEELLDNQIDRIVSQFNHNNLMIVIESTKFIPIAHYSIKHGNTVVSFYSSKL